MQEKDVHTTHVNGLEYIHILLKDKNVYRYKMMAVCLKRVGKELRERE